MANQIDNLKFNFTQSPEKQIKPSVSISFSGKNFNYENGLSIKIHAQYCNLEEVNGVFGNSLYAPIETTNSFSQEYLSGYLHEGFNGFLCPGFDKVFVTVTKTKSFTGYRIKFQYYYDDPNNVDKESFCFATSTGEVAENPSSVKNYYEQIIYGKNNDNLGVLKFYYHADSADELYELEENEERQFCFQNKITNEYWKEATLLYNDVPENGVLNRDDLYNNYPVNENGTVGESENYWDISKDLLLNTSGKYCLRVEFIDTNNTVLIPYQSTIITCKNLKYSSNEIAYFKPAFQYDRTQEYNPEYCVEESPIFCLTIPTEQNDYNNTSKLMKNIVYYRYSESINSIDEAKWEPFSSTGGKVDFNFFLTWLGASGMGGEIIDGEKTIVLQISDGVGNVSEIKKYDNTVSEESEEYPKYIWTKDSVRNIILHRTPPNSIVFNLIGSSGSEYYTGMYKDEDGHFIPSNKVFADIYAKENLNLPMEYKLYIGNNEDSAEWKKFDYPNDKDTYYHIPIYLDINSDYGIFENNYPASVSLVFRNSAGKLSEVEKKTIFFNSTILETDKLNLRESSSSYKPVVEYFNGDEYVRINELEDFDTTIPKRSWSEIFYPETHSFPIDRFGNIDVDEALKITSGDVNYDQIKFEEIKIESGEGENKTESTIKKIVYDDEQRPITIWDESTYSKKYRSLQSSAKKYNSDTGEIEGLAYWVIDNTGYSEFQLEFEHFHLDQTSHTQINDLSPFTGDCLVIYDASTEGATEEYINQYGKKAYKLVDSSKLKMLAAYSGDGINANRIYPEENAGSLNATANGAFTTEKFDTNRICVIFYSDGAGEKSGFKIKASPARNSDWLNWEVDYKRGEVWLHKLDTELLEGNTLYTPTEQAGYCPSKVRMSYEYSETSFDIDYENGSVKFYEKPQGQIWGTFSYFNYSLENGAYKIDEQGNNIPITYTFALADDDLVEYKDVSFYVSNIDENNKINIDKTVFYNVDGNSYGKIVSNIELDKDSGLLEFKNTNPPKGRIFADYYCHSYYRLTDDGYGNLYFYDEVIVPDKTENYPDFTYVDLKVVNEGEATLNNGRITFTYRGIASGSSSTTITSVLNPDRPWDIQVGTPEETFDQTRGEARTEYNFPEMNFNEALRIYTEGNESSVPFKVKMEFKKEIYLRIVWTMFTGGSETSPNYITPSSSGEKCFSGEIEGSFYTIQI